ncbi:MAG: TolC family protein, partial [Nitrospirae bacterium]|nr:TolC family protein [Nitrospirota bacterium]
PTNNQSIENGEKLTLTKCIELALKNQPTLTASQAAMYAVQTTIEQAKSSYYPQISANGGYNRIASPVVSTGFLMVYNQFFAGASLNQLIYDFGHTSSYVDVAKSNYEASSASFNNNVTQAVFNVKQAYFNMAQAMRNLDVAEEAVKQFKQHLDQAEAFYKVGLKAKIDVTTAKVNFTNARLQLITAKDAIKIARVNLRKTIGIMEIKDFTIVDDLSINKYNLSLEDAIKEAIEIRPDLKAAKANTSAAQNSVKYNESNYYPTITGSANVNGYDYSMSSPSRTWTTWGASIGAQINFNIFNGFITKKQVEQAQLTLNSVRATEESIRQSVITDVEQAYLNLMDAFETIPEAELAVQEAKDNLDIVNGRYSTGLSSPIEVTDAEISYENAKLTHIKALTAYKLAEATIEKAIGIK